MVQLRWRVYVKLRPCKNIPNFVFSLNLKHGIQVFRKYSVYTKYFIKIENLEFQEKIQNIRNKAINIVLRPLFGQKGMFLV